MSEHISKEFVVVEGHFNCRDSKKCKALHWDCPFCNAQGGMNGARIPEYFSITCHSKGLIFLVHNPMQDTKVQ